ncbi:MAG: DUF3899 domain-containing protein [Acholeplasmataceae bacterium]
MLKRLWKNILIRYTVIGLVLGLLFLGGFLLWSQNTTLIGYIDALTIAVLLVFAVGWFLFFSNFGALSGLFYAMRTFFGAIIGKRPEKSYYEEQSERELIPNAVYYGFWLASIPFLIALIILYIIYLNSLV